MATMEFQILSEQREQVEKAFNKMRKHISEATIQFGNPRDVYQRTYYIDKCEGVNNVHKYRNMINVIDVAIDGIGLQDWELVARVCYRDRVVVMYNGKLFKGIPQQYGVDYTTCDFCGHHVSKDAYVIYNKLSHEYKQVGSSCMAKVCAQHKYLSAFMVTLSKVVECIIGWGDGEPRGWSVPDHYAHRAYRFSEAIADCIDYYNNVSQEWKRSDYNYEYHFATGTNAELQEYTRRGDVDAKLIDAVINYAKTLEESYDECDMPTFDCKIKNAAENEFIPANEMYIAWFAYTKYLQSITSKDFEELVASRGIEKGAKVRVIGTITDMEFIAGDYYNRSCYIVTIAGNDGLKYIKEISHAEVLDPYKNESGEVNFEAAVKYIAFRRQCIGLGGRVRK